jgi:hypothetical protein
VRVAHAVARALEKDPAARFPTMDAFAAELEACLAALGPEDDAEVTLVRRPPVVPPGSRRLLPAGLVALGLVLVALAVAALLLHRSSGRHSKRGSHGGASAARPVHLAGVTGYDPYGDNHAEHDQDAPKATDRDPATYWTTEHYDSFTKAGVGLVLAAPSGAHVRRIVLRTDTPGFAARIESGSSESGPFPPVSPLRTVASTTTFRVGGRPARYYVVWITKLPGGVAHVNEVRAFS